VQKLLSPDKGGRPRLYVAKNCENLIREMRGYRWRPGYDMPLDRDNHAVDALRYAPFSDFSECQPDWALLRMPEQRRRAV
jgi:hypothetical protein